MDISSWTAVLRGDMKLYWGRMGVRVAPFPAELYQRGEGARLFYFFFFITFHEGEFLRSRISLS